MQSTYPNFIFFFFNDTATTEIYTFPYTTLFRSHRVRDRRGAQADASLGPGDRSDGGVADRARHEDRSEEHTSELQSLAYLVCRLLLEKKKNNETYDYGHMKCDSYGVVLNHSV